MEPGLAGSGREPRGHEMPAKETENVVDENVSSVKGSTIALENIFVRSSFTLFSQHLTCSLYKQ